VGPPIEEGGIGGIPVGFLVGDWQDHEPPVVPALDFLAQVGRGDPFKGPFVRIFWTFGLWPFFVGVGHWDRILGHQVSPRFAGLKEAKGP